MDYDGICAGVYLSGIRRIAAGIDAGIRESAMNFAIVDDDPITRRLVTLSLEEAGHSVKCYESGVQALREIPADRPDCVISDIIMRDMDGFELCRELRRAAGLAAVKIIMFSAKSYDFDRRRAKELGADGYIVKPIQRDALLRAINEILSGQVTVCYWGVRGTLPVSGTGSLRYGGNTSCVSVEINGEPMYIFDCGTGIKQLSDHLVATKTSGSRRGFSFRTRIGTTSTPFPFSRRFMSAAIRSRCSAHIRVISPSSGPSRRRWKACTSRSPSANLRRVSYFAICARRRSTSARSGSIRCC